MTLDRTTCYREQIVGGCTSEWIRLYRGRRIKALWWRPANFKNLFVQLILNGILHKTDVFYGEAKPLVDGAEDLFVENRQ